MCYELNYATEMCHGLIRAYRSVPWIYSWVKHCHYHYHAYDFAFSSYLWTPNFDRTLFLYMEKCRDLAHTSNVRRSFIYGHEIMWWLYSCKEICTCNHNFQQIHKIVIKSCWYAQKYVAILLMSKKLCHDFMHIDMSCILVHDYIILLRPYSFTLKLWHVCMHPRRDI